MKIVDLKSGKTVPSLPGKCVLALGNFDGVHVGHAELIKRAVETAEKSGLVAAAWTFDVHPLTCLGRIDFKRLTSEREKNSAFASLGLKYAVYEDFMRVKEMKPEEFALKVLIGALGCETAVCGFNFTFGKGGAGTPETLKTVMEEAGKGAIVVPPVIRRGRIVSSSAVRFFVEQGLTEEAAELLGRPFSIDFPVIEGKKLGRRIGIPTINQTFPKDHIKPKQGIYAATCKVGEDEYYCVANVGSRPTVNSDENDVNCETHIIDYSGWLYGKNVRVSFYKRLRDEIRFDSVEALGEAVKKDVSAAISYFGDRTPPKK